MFFRSRRSPATHFALVVVFSLVTTTPAGAALPLLGKRDADHLVLGNTVDPEEQAFTLDVGWGSHIVWGDNTVSDEYTWGSHIVWRDSRIGGSDGQHIVWRDTTFTVDSVAWGHVAASSCTPADALAATGGQP